MLGKDPAVAGIETRIRIGYAPEHHDLPSELTASDLVRHLAEMHLLPSRAAMQRANDALWLVGLGEERFRPVTTMSTGERQRVKLAAAIAHDPELVLLDEPTDGLDPVQRGEMLDLIRRIGTEFGMHIVVSSHHLEEVERICDAVVIVEGGTVVREGRLDELRRGPEGLVVEVDDKAEELAALLAGQGYEAVADGSMCSSAARTACTKRCEMPSPSSVSACAASSRAGGRSKMCTSESKREHGTRGPALRPRLSRLRRPAQKAGRGDADAGGLHRQADPRHRARWTPQGAARDHARRRLRSCPHLARVRSPGGLTRFRRPHLVRRLRVLHRQRAGPVRGAAGARGAVPGPPVGPARPLPRRPARPHALPRRQVGGGVRRDAAHHRRPAALPARQLPRRRVRPERRRGAELLLRIVGSGIVIALLYAALSMAVSSFTTRKAAAAIATVLVLIVPAAIVRPAIERRRARTSSTC